MSRRTVSEVLVMNFFAAHDVGCTPVPTRPDEPTPDFVIELAQQVVCEVKQIEPNKDDHADLAETLRPGERRAIGRWVPNRIRPILKNISPQLHRASEDGTPTLLVVYDATPFQIYSDDTDVVQAMFG